MTQTLEQLALVGHQGDSPVIGIEGQQTLEQAGVMVSKLSTLVQNEMLMITSLALFALLKKESIQLIDVRQPYERDICHIGGELAPLPLFETYLERFSKDKSTVVYCRSGVRSAKACQILQEAGFSQVHNLEGGMMAWIDSVDQSLMKY